MTFQDENGDALEADDDIDLSFASTAVRLKTYTTSFINFVA